MIKFLFLLLFAPALTFGQYITTIAGNGALANTGDGGLAIQAELANPRALCFDKNGNMYVACVGVGSVIRKIDPSGIITTFAGSDSSGYAGDGGPATAALLYAPRQIAIDVAGNIYITDDGNYRIRKVDTSGIITTFAGNGTFGFSGDGGPATAAQIATTGIFFDSSGNAYLADVSNQRIRIIDTIGTINTIAGTGTPGYSGDGGPATNATLNTPSRILFYGGNIYFTDEDNNCIRKINDSGTISTFVGDGTGAPGYYGDGGPASACELNNPVGLCVDKNGDFYISDAYNFAIRKITFIDGIPIINTLAGNGYEGYNGDCIPATDAKLDDPYGVETDASGAVYIADNFNNRIRKVVAGPCTEAVNTITHPSEAIQIFPNPATDELTIIASDKINNIMITNLLGQNIFNGDYKKKKVTVNVSPFPPGVYFIKLNGITVKKFIKE